MITLILAVHALAIWMLALKITSLSVEIDDLRSRLMDVKRRQLLDNDDRSAS